MNVTSTVSQTYLLIGRRVIVRSVLDHQPQRQKQALTQMRGAGCDGEQPHISFGPVHSLSLVHSLWQ
jgi:hypothetical protein